MQLITVTSVTITDDKAHDSIQQGYATTWHSPEVLLYFTEAAVLGENIKFNGAVKIKANVI